MNPGPTKDEGGVCRTCMCRTSNMKSLYSQMEADSRTLLEVLTYVADVSVIKEENLPDQLCVECISNMCIADTFKRMCKKSEDSLRLSVNTKELITKNYDDIKLFCGDCSIHFSTASEFTTHMECHEQPYQCSICALRFTMWDTLNNHLSLNHARNIEQVQKFQCEHCEINFDCHNTFEKHIISCTNNISDCGSPRSELLYNSDCKVEASDECGNENIDSPDLTNTTSFKKKSYSCKECKQNFSTKKTYKEHIKVTHSIKPKPFPLTKQAKKKINKILGTKERMQLKRSDKTEIYKTDNQDIKLESYDVKETQIDNEKNILPTHHCTMCARKFVKKTSLEKHLKRHEAKMDENHSCSICHREFKHKAHLINHMVSIHVSEQRLKCNLCSKTFSTEDSLKMHLVNHKNQKKHECIICEKAFNMLSTLKDHMRTHTGEKPYLCATCGRGFSQKTNLKEHIQRHLGYKPFVCNSCDQSFVTKGELSAHSRKHSGAHPFKCDTCNAGFTTSSSLVKHRRIHTGERPYMCGLCPMRFSALGTLKNHHRTHTGEKPFKCNFCEKAFAQKNDLVSHTRCHTGERPFVCSVCGQAFRQNSALKTHLKVHSLKDTTATIPPPTQPRMSINKEIATLFTLDLTTLNVSNASTEVVSTCAVPVTENTK